MEVEVEEYYYRLICLVVDIGTEVMLNLFKKEIPPSHTTERFLNSQMKKIKELKRRKVLNDFQYNVLTVAPIDMSKFDITLLCVLISNLTKIQAPNGGWDIKTPLATDTSPGALIINLRGIRNAAIAHKSKGKLMKSEFEKHWQETEGILVGLSGEIGHAEQAAVKKDIAHAKVKQFIEDPKCKENALGIWKLQEDYSDLAATVDQIKQKVDQRLGHVSAAVQKNESSLQELGTDVQKVDQRLGHVSAAVQKNESSLQELGTDVQKVDQRLGHVSAAVQKNESSLQELGTDVQKVDQRLGHVSAAVQKNESSLQELGTDVQKVDQRLGHVSAAVQKNECSLQELGTYIQKVEQRQDHVSAAVQKNESSLQELGTDIQKVDQRQDHLSAAVQKNESSIQALQTDVQKLSAITMLYDRQEGNRKKRKGEEFDETLPSQRSNKQFKSTNTADSGIYIESEQHGKAPRRKLGPGDKAYEKIKQNLRKEIMDHYRRINCCKTAIPALIKGRKVDVNEVFVMPTMRVVEPGTSTSSPKDSGKQPEYISTIHEMFISKGEAIGKVYLRGEAGTGKTTLCQKIMSQWYNVHTGQQTENKADEEKFLKNIELLFYIPLRNRITSDIIEMIKTEVIRKCHYNDLDLVLENESENCLIILDGLDEWTSTDCKHETLT